MSVRIRTVAIACGLLFALSAAAGRAQPLTPPRQERQAPPAMKGPGMTGPGTMRGPMMGDMSQMTQACAQMMSQMMEAMAPPAHSGPEAT